MKTTTENNREPAVYARPAPLGLRILHFFGRILNWKGNPRQFNQLPNSIQMAYEILAKFGKPMGRHELFLQVRKSGSKIKSTEGFGVGLSKDNRFKCVGRKLWVLTDWPDYPAFRTIAKPVRKTKHWTDKLPNPRSRRARYFRRIAKRGRKLRRKDEAAVKAKRAPWGQSAIQTVSREQLEGLVKNSATASAVLTYLGYAANRSPGYITTLKARCAKDGISTEHFVRYTSKHDWSAVDWTKTDRQLADELHVVISTVWLNRKKFGQTLPPSTALALPPEPPAVA